ADRQQSERDETLRPLLKSLVDAYDALALARREIKRVRDTVLPEMERMQEFPRRLAEKTQESSTELPSSPEPPMAEAAPPRGARLFGTRVAPPPAPPTAGSPAGNSLPGPSWREEIAGEQRETAERLGQAAARVRQMLAALLTGYTMGMQ